MNEQEDQVARLTRERDEARQLALIMWLRGSLYMSRDHCCSDVPQLERRLDEFGGMDKHFYAPEPKWSHE